MKVALARLAASLLRGLAAVLLIVGDLANPVLTASRRCDERAREWDPRLWARGGHTDLGAPPLGGKEE